MKHYRGCTMGKISAIRFSTLEAICEVLDCQPGDILEYDRTAAAPAAAVDNSEQPESKTLLQATGYQACNAAEQRGI